MKAMVGVSKSYLLLLFQFLKMEADPSKSDSLTCQWWTLEQGKMYFMPYQTSLSWTTCITCIFDLFVHTCINYHAFMVLKINGNLLYYLIYNKTKYVENVLIIDDLTNPNFVFLSLIFFAIFCQALVKFECVFKTNQSKTKKKIKE